MDKKKQAAELIIETKRKLAHCMGHKMGEKGMTLTQAIIVGHLFHKKQMKISEISAILGLSNSTVSGVVDRLEKIGAVVRARSEKDRRVVYVKVDDRFALEHKGIETTFGKFLEDLLSDAAAEETDKIIEGLTVLIKYIDKIKETGE